MKLGQFLFWAVFIIAAISLVGLTMNNAQTSFVFASPYLSAESISDSGNAFWSQCHGKGQSLSETDFKAMGCADIANARNCDGYDLGLTAGLKAAGACPSRRTNV